MQQAPAQRGLSVGFTLTFTRIIQGEGAAVTERKTIGIVLGIGS